MPLQIQNFSTLVSNAAAAVQGAAAQLVDLTVGSTLRAILEANASMALWLQWLVLQVLQTTRAATSQGSDLDSWMADFAFARLPANSAVGTVTFSRFTASNPVIIPVGANVRTGDASQSFAVEASPSHPNWNAALTGFQMPAGLASVILPVRALNPGYSGNVQAGAISLLSTAVPGVDAVSNLSPTIGGVDAEPDAALRTRFQDYIASLSRATLVSVRSAIASVQFGLSFVVRENVNPDNSPRPGGFLVVVDDGTGTPSQGLLTRVATAVEQVRPIGTSFAVIAPTLIQASISLTVASDGSVSQAALTALARMAITTYINTMPIGTSLPFARVTQLVFSASPAVSNVTALIVNGSTADLYATPTSVIRAASVVVS